MKGRLVLTGIGLCVEYTYFMTTTPELRRMCWKVETMKGNPYTAERPEAGDIVESQHDGNWSSRRHDTHRSSGSVYVNGKVQAISDELVPVPAPKVRKGILLEWRCGAWCKLLKSGWVPV